MGKVNIAKGQVLHRKGESAETLELILKGSMLLKDNGEVVAKAGNGTVLGAFYKSGEIYRYDCVAAEDTTLVTYDYGSEEDLIEVIKSYPAIAPVVTSANVALLIGLLDTLSSLHDKGCALCTDLKNAYTEYRNHCAALMIQPQKYEVVEQLQPPEEPEILNSWQADMWYAYYEQDELLRKNFYGAGLDFCVGSIMLAAKMAREIQPAIVAAVEYLQETHARTSDFSQEYHVQKAKIDDAKRQEVMEAGSGQLPSIKNALAVILSYAGVEEEVAAAFRRDIKSFMDAPDKAEKSDEMRRLRRDLTTNFFHIYEQAFFRSQEDGQIPAEVKMFFLFGFVDENLAGIANTSELYKHALLWEDDPQGKVLPVYNWLSKIYKGELVPSKNEFDNDWEEYLREEVRTGGMTQEEADKKLDDRQAMVSFELHNMISSANKMTFGSVFSYVPVFYASSVVRPLENCLATPQKVHAAIDKVREVDYGCFYRPAFVSYPELKINRYDYNEEIEPYVVLLPNFGSRGLLWQEIEGRRRTTPGRMVISIYHSADLDNTIVKMCAQFRWEMCKRIQGVHYSDVTDPSLTAEYCNYLQFYKKNYELSPDMKERVKTTLKRNRNNYRSVFMSEYELYVQQEAFGLPKLNKVAREILFRYCTFSKKFRNSMAANPQYQNLISRWTALQEAKLRSLKTLTVKVAKLTDEMPAEIKKEEEYLNL